MINVSDMLVDRVSDFPEEIEKARQSTNRKLFHTIDTWQKDRPCLKKWFDLFPGDFATRRVASFLLSSGIHVTIYDDIREDGFMQPDPYDLKVGDVEIDVKSSLLKQKHIKSEVHETLRGINEMNIIAYSSKIKDVHVQVFFWLANNPSFFDEIESKHGEPCFSHTYSLQIDEVKEYEKEFIEKGIVVVAGWADKNSLVSANERMERGSIRANTKRRSYKHLKLKEASTIEELVDFLRGARSLNS